MAARTQHAGSCVSDSPHQELRADSGAIGSNDVPLFRYRLRHLLAFFVVASLILAGMMSSNGTTALGLLLTTFVVAGHLLATALGSQLRSRADHRQLRNTAESGSAGFSCLPDAGTGHVFSGTRSPWHSRGGGALSWLPRLVVVAAILGGICGGLFLAAAVGHRTSPAGVAIGAISIAVVSGWFAFLGGSFYGIFRQGLRDALAEQGPPKLR